MNRFSSIVGQILHLFSRRDFLKQCMKHSSEEINVVVCQRTPAVAVV